MVNAGLQIAVFAVFFNFTAGHVKKGPDYADASFARSFICNACQTVGACTPENSEKNSLALVTCILGHCHSNIFSGRARCCKFFCHGEESIVACLSACFLRGHFKSSGKFIAVNHKTSACCSSCPAQFFHIPLVLFSCARSELMIHMNRMNSQVHVFSQLHEHIKKAH